MPHNRYTLTYTPSEDRILPSPPALYVRIKNEAAIPLRAAYLHGPYNIYVAAYPVSFNPHEKSKNQRRDGTPQFEPYLKPGGEWTAKLPVPEDMRETAETFAQGRHPDGARSMTWVIEIASQILFSLNAAISFEVLVSRDEKSLDIGWAAIAGKVRGEPGQVVDHQLARHGRDAHTPAQVRGVHSKAVKLVVDDTLSLWNQPPLPKWDERPQSKRRSTLSRRISQRNSTQRSDTTLSDPDRPKKQKKVHLVVLTHGLHSNLGADMLFLKESIDATVKAAKDSKKERKRAEANPEDSKYGSDSPNDKERVSTAPLSGGQEQKATEDDEEDEEQVVVRGFSGNATKTEKGIQYLGKRLAKFVLEMTYPDQPFLPIKKSMSGRISSAFSSQSSKDSQGDVPAHANSSIQKPDEKVEKRAYKYTSISFVGHSLGGLVQLYAIAYIQKHSPGFFDVIEPVNFVALATPFLGLSNENPVYVKFALDFGLVGRTGQDLGLTWRPPTLARSGWSAMVGGLGGAAQKEDRQEDPGAKPLLRILPTGPAHQVLRRFRNRTVYSNVVNDGIVPLRTSCLLFLDWRGLGKVDKARRENGLIGTVANWGWAEMMGQHSSPHPTQAPFTEEDSDGRSTPLRHGDNNHDLHGSEVPQPTEDTTNIDDETQAAAQRQTFFEGQRSEEGNGAVSPGPIDTILNFFRPTSPLKAKPAIKPPSKKDSKMFKRSQTLKPPDWDYSGSESASSSRPSYEPHIPNREEGEHGDQAHMHKRPLATRGDSILEDPTNMHAPPKTSIFESAGDLLAPPIPSTAWINDPSSRVRTIFHDRVYHPEDIPPAPKRRPSRIGRTMSTDASMSTSQESARSTNSSLMSDQTLGPNSPPDVSGMRVEEKIARAYHRDLTWRKVLVRLEPDAHNNIVVRRMFANAYGWPVIKHLCDTHFGDTFAANTRDEHEPAADRAKPIEKPIGDHGEHVKGQEDAEPPPRNEVDMREEADELKPLKKPSDSSAKKRMSREDSGSWDERYFDSDDEDNEDENDGRNAFQRFLSPPPKKRQEPEAGPSRDASPRVAKTLTEEPDDLEALTRSQTSGPPEATPSDLVVSTSMASPTTGLGLRQSLEKMVSPPESPTQNKRPESKGSSSVSGPDEGISERVARLSMAGES